LDSFVVRSRLRLRLGRELRDNTGERQQQGKGKQRRHTGARAVGLLEQATNSLQQCSSAPVSSWPNR